MSELFTQHHRGEGEIPATQLAWQVFGAGLEKVGKEKEPVEVPVPQPGPDELLARVDAAGICFSDIKIIRQGGDHPRLFGRDLAREPIVPGHEVACTVVKVGEKLQGQYQVGDRFVVQADIYYQGNNIAFGYLLPGAFEQYVLLGKEILRGDDGVYLIPIEPDTGYAEAALSEPWACVVCAYRTDFRRHLTAGGITWILGGPGSEGFKLGALAEQPGPARIVLTEVAPDLTAEVASAAERWGAEPVATGPLAEINVATVQEQQAPDGFDDIILIGNHPPELVEALSAALGKQGILTLMTDQPLPRPVEIDLGRVHYDYTRYYGSRGKDLAAAYQGTRSPTFVDGGKAWIVGGGGPMGQMHVQIAAQGTKGPEVIVVSDLDSERLALMAKRLGPVAESRGRQLIVLNPQEMGQETFDARLREIAPEGFDDLHLLVPVPALIADTMRFAGESGLVDIFAGIPRGSMAKTDLSLVALRNMRLHGTSGSSIEDLEQALRMTESGEIDTNASVAGIGGLEATRDGLEAVQDQVYPGKIVIYPQIHGLPLTPITELAEKLPEVAALLGPGGIWTRAAEKALLEHFLRRNV